MQRMVDALGIVDTPVEIVDVIRRGADDLLKKHFGRGLTDEGVHVLDPFKGMGTFMARLLQSGLTKPDDLARKYTSELHATEIMLLAYYVAAVPLETTYNVITAEHARKEAESRGVKDSSHSLSLNTPRRRLLGTLLRAV